MYFNLFRNSLEYSFIFFILVPHSFGRCYDMLFSLCWLDTEDALNGQNGNLWLNGTSLNFMRKAGRVTSVTVSPVVENKVALQYGGFTRRWTLAISPRTKMIKITGKHKPLEQPANATKGFLELLEPTEVFACESGTTFLHQDENFFLAVGHTLRFPIKLESRSPFMLLVSWLVNSPEDVSSHTVTLYHTEMGSYNPFFEDNTTLDHYRFTALDSCTRYVVCVELAHTYSFTCLSTISDPDVPKYFEVTSWSSSRISLAWDCPANLKYSVFLLTIFYLNGTDHVTEEAELWMTDDSFTFTLSDLQPCVRLKFGLQTVCQLGLESRYSRMVLNKGNSDFSNIYFLHQTSFAPNNYTLSWEVKNTSSISMFRVYHEGALKDTTLLTMHTVAGLLPCQKYQAKVAAVCGDNVLMSVRTITAQTGPGGVSELRFRASDSTAVWTPSLPNQQAVAYMYKLSLENSSVIESSRVFNNKLPLSGLEAGKAYILDIWEECNGLWASEPSRLGFEGANSTFEIDVRAIESPHNNELQIDFNNIGLKMVVPWSLPDDQQNDPSESRAKLDQILKTKLEELLKDYERPARIELDFLGPADEPARTAVLFRSFDASNTNVDLPVDDQLRHIGSLNMSDISVENGVIYWDGSNLCASMQPFCPRNSVCVNSLGSYRCVCQDGYYDVGSFLHLPAASHPVCKDRGLFSQCLERVMMGGIAKAYLTSLFGGKLEVKLNDGQCPVNETEVVYYFNTSRHPPGCGMEKKGNKTHVVLQNTLSISLSKEHTISRRDLKVVWKCIYPRHYVRNAQVVANMEWLSSLSLVKFNSSVLLGLTMYLFKDESYSHAYTDPVELGHEDTLYFQVALQTNRSFASDVLLQVESCWATESTDPQDSVQAVFLEDGCPTDNTFQWLSANGLAQRSRFSIQMFHMPKGLPLYFHCLTNVCGHKEDCTRNCSIQQRPKRSAGQTDRQEKQAAVVSAGPLTVSMRVKSSHPSDWAEHMSMVIIAASISFLGISVLSLTAIKAVMMYYEKLRLQ
ncbi:uncharacterized protein LOC111611806 isoform X1 [Xiphophorus maculatus]|uniref:Uncharacterized LOC111611806 n=1 Tax=Xiphophorus maculatus TaxID=8083 RepID=A0A3B5PT15_XIPMA|nr:uncharacterized protein LOC111611806 isoform X1 [Xiphophorus maculatus]